MVAEITERLTNIIAQLREKNLEMMIKVKKAEIVLQELKECYCKKEGK